MVALSRSGEICDIQDADQFQVGKSEFECGFFGVAMCRSMAQVGHPPTMTMQQVIADAETWYQQYNGSNASWNEAGMSLEQEYELLHQVGLHYQETALDINIIKKWLAVGYPVIVSIAEASVYDMALHAAPYPWRAAGNHIIVITGVTSDGNLLVRDSANCTNLYDPHSLRPGPRRYDANRLALVSATVVVPPWLPRPTSSVPPVASPPVVAHPPIVPTPVVKPMEGLYIGAIVLYSYDFGLGASPSPVPAIVCRVYDAERGAIMVREMESMDMKSCLYSAKKEAGSWHWPEKA